MTFRVGQKVVCVDARDCQCGCGTKIPLKDGEIYTVTWISPEPDYRGNYGIGVAGVQPSQTLRHRSGGFASPRFRPAVERKTDISIFTKMLDGSPLSIEAQQPVAHGTKVEQA